MHLDGTGENGLAVLWDARSQACHVSESVFNNWRIGRQAIGKDEWARTLRMSLRDHGEVPWTAKQVKEKKNEALALLRQRNIRVVVIPQSPSVPGVRQCHNAWNMFGANGSPYAWAGTILERNGLLLAPVLCEKSYDAVYAWLIARWVRQAHAIARGSLKLLEFPKGLLHATEETRNQLTLYCASKTPLAVDIETNMAGTIITAIGLSNGKTAVSVPWDEYPISGTFGEREPALESYASGEPIKRRVIEILQNAAIPKILHNGTFDVLQLRKHGINLRGFNFDTLLMHRVAYPQFRHGLQQACATEFAVPPWKSLFKPPKVAQDLDPWLGEPMRLREYNSQDAFATAILFQHLQKKVGLNQ